MKVYILCASLNNREYGSPKKSQSAFRILCYPTLKEEEEGSKSR